MATRKKKPQVEAPKLALEEYRALLADERHPVKIKLNLTDLQGSLSTVGETLNMLVEASEIEGAWEIKYVPPGRAYYSGPSWNIVGSRPYTDAELLKEGNKLLASKARRAATAKKQRAKTLADLNKINQKLGLPRVELDDLPDA